MKTFVPQHPYARYGLALTMLKGKIRDVNQLTSKMLSDGISDGLNRFRMRTHDSPATSELLRFDYCSETELKRSPMLIQSSGLPKRGVFLAPTIITEEKGVKKTFGKAQTIRKLLNQQELDRNIGLTRSIAPMSAKLNNGKRNQSEQQSSLFEAACATITTVCEEKPAAWDGGMNMTVIPDLPLEQLVDFIDLFQRMIQSQLGRELLVAKVARTNDKDQSKSKKKSKSTTKRTRKNDGYRRPGIFNGNYPFAPRKMAFGAVGLLGAIGKWARIAEEINWGKRVLESVVSKPLYLISYAQIREVQFGHHIVRLSMSGDLSDLIVAINSTRAYAHDETKTKWQSPNKEIYGLFDLMASRFLQLFTEPAFRDLLAIRAEYQPQLYPLFKEFFMEEMRIKKEIVESARELGAWLNYVAYVAASHEIGDEKTLTPDQRREKVRKAKAKALVELESSAMGARTPSALLAQVITRAGRLSSADAPSTASTYMDAVATGELNLETAKQLMIAFARLSTYKGSSEAVGEDNYPIPQND